MACGVSVCILYWRCWTLQDLLQWKRIGFWVFLAGLLLLSSEVAGALAWKGPAWFDWRIIGIDLIVGFNEEVSYRGLFQRALTEIKGSGWGEWVSSLMFTAMHLGYQPFSELIPIFLWGLVAAKMRSRGAAIGFLIVIHWLADSAYVVCWKDIPELRPSLTTLKFACLFAALGAIWIADLYSDQKAAKNRG